MAYTPGGRQTGFAAQPQAKRTAPHLDVVLLDPECASFRRNPLNLYGKNRVRRLAPCY